MLVSWRSSGNKNIIWLDSTLGEEWNPSSDISRHAYIALTTPWQRQDLYLEGSHPRKKVLLKNALEESFELQTEVLMNTPYYAHYSCYDLTV